MKLLSILLAALTIAAWVPPAHGQGGDVELALDQFGLNSVYRPGEVAGIRLSLKVLPESALEEATPVWVQWEVPNADGDIAEYGQTRTLTKNRSAQVWLYAPLPPETSGVIWSVRVYEYRDDRRGRELGGLRISAPTVTNPPLLMRTAFLGVVGSRPMGLSQYTFGVSNLGRPVPSSHENTQVIFGLQPEDLPDRWEGLRMLEALAWSDELPQDLSSAQAEAIREWIRRGGHFIIVLPQDANPWGLGDVGRTEFQDVLPPAPRRDESVMLSDLLPILSKSQGLAEARADFPMSVRVFKELRGEFDALGNGYEPLIALPDGRVVVVQRLFGHGRITVAGIDVGSRQMESRPLANGQLMTLPQADVFWNRILGRRADTPVSGELSQIAQADRLSADVPDPALVGQGELFASQIGMSTTAGAGLALALLLFAAYWIAAGPGGYAVLKRYRQARQAWVAFAVTAAVFTAVAWAGVTLLRSREPAARHVTFLDHIARQEEIWSDNDPQLQRAISWLSMYLPGYGDTGIGIDSLEAGPATPPMRDLLYSWENPDPGKGAQQFENVDRYTVDLRRQPDDFAIPTRSTATEFTAEWLGGLDPAWGGLLRVDPADPLRVEADPGGPAGVRLVGTIISELPGTLSRAKLVWIRNRRNPNRRYAPDLDGSEAVWTANSGVMPNLGCFRDFGGGQVEPGTVVPVLIEGVDVTGRALRLSRNIEDAYIKQYRGSSILPGAQNLNLDRSRRSMEMLSLFHQLTPPSYLKSPDRSGEETARVARDVGRRADLSAWFTRPCVIVTGFLEESACPIPLRVNGEPFKSQGLTMVRWIYPLPLNEEIAFTTSAAEEETEGSGR